MHEVNISKKGTNWPYAWGLGGTNLQGERVSYFGGHLYLPQVIQLENRQDLNSGLISKPLFHLPHPVSEGCYWPVTGAINRQRGGVWTDAQRKKTKLVEVIEMPGRAGSFHTDWRVAWQNGSLGYGDALFHYIHFLMTFWFWRKWKRSILRTPCLPYNALSYNEDLPEDTFSNKPDAAKRMGS